MKEIDRAFGLKMLEKIIGQPASEIEAKAQYESDMWPMGYAEFGASLEGNMRIAKIIIDYYKGKRPKKIKNEDIGEIFNQIKTQNKPMTDKLIDHYRNMINMVFDIYED